MIRATRDGQPVLPDLMVRLTARQASLIVGLARCRISGGDDSPAADWRDLAAVLETAGVQGWDASDPTSDALIHYPHPDDGLPGLTAR